MIDYSIVDSVFKRLQLSVPVRLVILEGSALSTAHTPPYPPDCPALIVGVDAEELLEKIMVILGTIYPDDHLIQVVDGVEKGSLRISEMGALGMHSARTCFFIPPLTEGSSFESFAEIVARLRAPDGCPWDREQTHESLRTHMLEETYEALAAIDAGDSIALQEELGDLLLQIVLQAQIAHELGEFTSTRVIHSIYDKIVRRHPHVFGDLKLDGVEGVLQNWEKLKEQERGGKREAKGLLDGVPLALPALAQAQEYQDRAARVGFDWPEIEGVLDKVKEEIEEIKQAQNQEQVASELGDLFFVLVNLARWKKVDAESVLREANAKFKRRFAYVEQGAKVKNKLLTEMTLEEMDALWEQGKRAERL